MQLIGLLQEGLDELGELSQVQVLILRHRDSGATMDRGASANMDRGAMGESDSRTWIKCAGRV